MPSKSAATTKRSSAAVKRTAKAAVRKAPGAKTGAAAAKTKAAAKPKTAVAKTRRLTAPKRIWYKPLTWRHRLPVPDYKPLPKARVLFGRGIKQMWRNWRVFGGITFIYGMLTLLLVRGFSGTQEVGILKASLDLLLEDHGGELVSSLVTFTSLFGTTTGTTATGGLYQSLLILICSLAVIWGLRQVNADRTVRIRDTFYQGMYPLVQFVLVFLLLSVQLVPLALGSSLYSLMITNGIAVHPWERITLAVLLLVLCVWSLRVITATFFALYIVTLPNMTPMLAYRNARQLVYGRRLLIWRKLIFLPVVLLLLTVVLVMPLIFFFTPAAVWAFFVLSLFVLPIIHSYMYGLYREML